MWEVLGLPLFVLKRITKDVTPTVIHRLLRHLTILKWESGFIEGNEMLQCCLRAAAMLAGLCKITAPLIRNLMDIGGVTAHVWGLADN